MVEFCDGQNQFKVPFMRMYADFESILEPIQGPNPDPRESYTSEVTHQTPSGWCVYSKFAYGEVKDPLKLLPTFQWFLIIYLDTTLIYLLKNWDDIRATWGYSEKQGGLH